MHFPKFFVVLISLVFLIGCESEPDANGKDSAKGKEITKITKTAEVRPVPADGLPLPWHTTDLYWHGAKSVENVKSIGVTFTVDRNIPDTVNLYIAPLGGQNLNLIMFYGGIQSNVNGWPSPTEQQRIHPGPGAIFSRWGGKPVSIDAARPVEGGLCESAGYEGEFVSVRKPIDWKAGTYTWELRKEESEKIEGQMHTWFACFLEDHDRNEEYRVGALRFEGETFSYSGESTSFVEIYSTSKIPFSAVPEVIVTFQAPVVNGKKMPITSVDVYHPRKEDGVDASASPAIGRAAPVKGGVQVELLNEALTGEAVPPSRYQLLIED